MTTVNIHDAKTHFSRLVDAAAQGETIVIAKAGKPLAKLTRLDSGSSVERVGFLRGHGSIPDDFDRMGDDEIAALFSGSE